MISLLLLMALFVVTVLLAATTEAYKLQETRNWGYRIASQAALRGVSAGRDWTYFYSAGQLRLEETTARNATQSALQSALATRGITAYTADVRVLPDPNGGSIINYPPVARASMQGATTWTTTRPAVGVYLRIPVSVLFFGWVDRSSTMYLNIFAASEVTGQ
jgi:hypothetical protein